MIERIVSGGQTGVDRAALDVALERGIPCGGWCPSGRLAEDGPIDPKYPLIETPSSDYAERTRWNVRDSDGTLILTWGPPADGTAFTIECAQELGKPHLVVNLQDPVDFGAISAWLHQYRIAVINIAGPRASKAPQIYYAAKSTLSNLLESI
ncbi:MAG: molybdenum cofactor carrier [Candidatus Hydrogenedentes bacterium]|nr:molybdenum cofactor carrier [Candidatus Hydrogenedentota bacterium]